MYFTPGATHAPHHVPKEWADKYKGKFDQGWDKLRETFARQKKLGVIPQECDLTARPDAIPAWDSQSTDFKRALAREMEVYAGFFEFSDHHIGRLIDALDQIKALDNTPVFYIIGDNGASAEGTPQGTYNEMIPFNGMNAIETPQFFIEQMDKLGGPESYNHYAVGWAHAMDTPYQWTKQVASHWGGTRNAMIVHWPKGIKARGEIRDGKAVGQGRVESTAPMVFSADETSDVGVKRGSPMTPDMPPEKSAFNGTVLVIVIETSGASLDHMISRDQLLSRIVARQ
jgi:arylsulfatase A-like enzyme